MEIFHFLLLSINLKNHTLLLLLNIGSKFNNILRWEKLRLLNMVVIMIELRLAIKLLLSILLRKGEILTILNIVIYLRGL